jgi:membrane-associated phospholipid phosphatase/MFS family permease
VNAVPLTRSPSRSRLAVRRVSPAARGGALASSGARLGGPALLFAFSLAAVGAGAGRALTTTYLPVLLERINDAPSLIGAVMTVNALAGFAVPIGVGVWSDRRGRRLPFIAGGAVLTAGGLVAVGLGNGTSYLALGLSAALVYAGLNALTTGHRAIVAEDVDDAGRPAATSAQEIAGLVGAVVAVAIGGALIEPAPAAAFALATVVLAITVVPTMIVSRRLGLGEREPAPRSGDADRADGSRAHAGRAANRFGRVLGDALRHPGAREVLVAQVLWVFAYAALPSFFVLYAEKSLGLGVGVAGALPLGFGLLTAVGMVVAGRAKPERVRPLLLAGAALLGGGLLAAAPAGSLAAAAPGFAAAAVGAGLVTALGFPYFARFVPAGEAGRYSGLFFAGRAVAAAAALPLAGLAVELTGSYTAVLWLGAAALAALAPLAAAERAGVAASRPPREGGAPRGRRLPAFRGGSGAQRGAFGARPASVAAVIPVFASERAVEVAHAALHHVDELVLVDDGAPPAIAVPLDALRGDDRVRILRLGENGGKGSAVAAGAELLLAESRSPEAIVVLDSDGQHDPERIPAFVEAAREADVVIGHRRDRSSMPRLRRFGNRVASLTLLASARAWIPDTQNGMRLFRSAVLRDHPLPPGGYDAESRHLRALLGARRSVASVEIPTIYDGEPSHYRTVTDTIRVGRALAGRPAANPVSAATSTRGTAADALAVLRAWMPRLGAVVLAAIALGLAMPLFQPLDSTVFLAVNGLGDGPEWLYQALDPHARNYVLLTATTIVVAAFVLRRPRYVLGAALGVVLAAYVAGAAIELVKLFVERARPEEVLGGQVLLSEGRSWAHLASFPSGHLIVTTAMASAAAVALPILRKPLIAYVVLIGLTRVLFGAHFPLDVLAGAVLGYEIGLFSARLMASARLLPVAVPEIDPEPLRLRPAAARSPRPR